MKCSFQKTPESSRKEVMMRNLRRRDVISATIGSASALAFSAVTMSATAQASEGKNSKNPSEIHDIVVVGAGAAGVACAIEAKTLGADVVLLEKCSRPDGNTLYSSGRLCCVGSRYQKGIEDSVEAFVKDEVHETQGVGDEKCLRAFAELSGSTIDWVIDMGVPLSLTKNLPAPNLSRAFFMKTDGTTGGSLLQRHMMKKMKALGVPMHVNTNGIELLTDETRRVIGIRTMTPEGPKDYFARGGVVLTTGGFSANEEMRTMYMGAWGARLMLRGSRQNTGENILMTRPLRAKLVNLSSFYAGPTVPETHANPARVSNSAYGMIVGKDGKRCVDESLGQAVRSKLLPQVTPDNRTFIICDAKTDDEDNILTKLIDRFNRLNSPVYKADTIEELARLAGIDGPALVASVKEFNDAIAAGKAKELVPPHNRKTPHPVATAPFYAIPMSGGIANTFGGPKINEKGEVVDLDDKPIPGLYAAGAAAGGLWYSEDIPGSQLSSCLVFGRITARSAAERAKKAAN